MLNPFGSRGPLALLAMGPLAVSATMVGMLVCIVATAVVLLGLLRALVGVAGIAENRRAVLLWWGAGALLIFAAWARFNFIQFQAQARYLHPALLPFALGFCRRLAAISGTRSCLAKSVLFAGLTLLGLSLWNIFGWTYSGVIATVKHNRVLARHFGVESRFLLP
jgi:hypothetical protein